MDDILKTVSSKLESGKLRVKCQSVQLKPITQINVCENWKCSKATSKVVNFNLSEEEEHIGNVTVFHRSNNFPISCSKLIIIELEKHNNFYYGRSMEESVEPLEFELFKDVFFTAVKRDDPQLFHLFEYEGFLPEPCESRKQILEYALMHKENMK